MELILSNLSRKDTIELLYLVYQHLSNINAQDLAAIQPPSFASTIYQTLFGATPATSDNKLINSPPAVMATVCCMRSQLYHAVCTGSLERNWYPYNEPTVDIRSCYNHLPCIDMLPGDNLSGSFIYSFKRLVHNRVLVDKTTLASMPLKEIQALLYSIYKRLSDINASEPTTTAIEAMEIVDRTRRVIYEDICKGVFKGPYSLGEGLNALVASAHFPMRDIKVSATAPPIYTYQPAELILN